MVTRRHLAGSPHSYLVEVRCALDQPLFADTREADHFLQDLETVRRAFDGRVFAYSVGDSSAVLTVQHHAELSDSDAQLHARWSALGGSGAVPAVRLQRRLTSLSGFMQTLLQRFSRAWNKRHGHSGSIWAGRFRACLLADDAAILATIAWLEKTFPPTATRRTSQRSRALPVSLASPPLRIGPDGQLLPADEAPPSLSPPSPSELHAVHDRFNAALSAPSLQSYGDALRHGWALGRPESLTDVMTRLGRGKGRGRSRGLRDLSDELGLCGVWG